MLKNKIIKHLHFHLFKFLFSIFILLISFNLFSVQTNIMEEIDKKFAYSLWSFAIADENGKIILEHNSNKLLVCGSVIKLITSLYSFETLGYDWRFKTEVYYSGYIKDNVLIGDLYIKGYNDMTLGSENFNSSIDDVFGKIYDALKEYGIYKIEGKIYGDSSLIDDFQEGSWEWQDIGNYYAARVSSLAINDNSYKIFLKTGNVGDKTEIVKVEPVDDVKFINEVITGEKNTGDNSYIYSNPYVNLAVIKGSVGKTDGLFVIKGAIADPPLFFVRSLYNYLLKKGISSYGYAKLQLKDNNAVLIKTIYSPPLYEIIKVMNKKSFNFYAQSLLKYIELMNRKEKKSSFKSIDDFLNSMGITKYKIVDGSGLSRRNLFSCDGFIKVLNKAKKESYYRYFYNSLVKPPDDVMAGGHIRGFGRKHNLDIAIKSGSLNEVRSYAGYIKKGGKDYSFCFIINNYLVKPLEIDEIVERLLYESTR